MNATVIPELFEQQKSRLKSGDYPAAIESAVAIDDADASIQSLISDFTTAIEQDDSELATVLLSKIVEKYESRNTDSVILNRALTVASDSEISEQKREQLIEYSQDIANKETMQSIFLTSSVGYLNQGGSDESTVIDLASSVKEIEEQSTNTGDAVEKITNDVQLDAVPAILNFSQPTDATTGTSIQSEITVGNTGDKSTDQLRLEFTSSDGVEVDEAFTLSSISPGEERSVEINPVVTLSGEQSVTAKLSNQQDVIDSTSISVSVTPDVLSVRESIVGPDSEQPSAATVQNAISLWANDNRVAQTGGKKVDTDTLQEIITDWIENTE